MGQPAGKIPSSGVVTIYRGTPGPEDRPRPRDFAAVFFSTSRESARQYGEHVTKYELPVDWLHILDIDGPEAVPLAREYMRIEGWEEAMFADDADVDDYMANYFMFPERGWVDFLGKKGYAGTSIGGDLALFRPALRMVRKAASLSILAFDYGAMFKALFADISRVGGSGSVTRCKDDFDFYLEWAKKALKRRDRIMWFMRLVRIHCAQEFLENESKLDKRYPADLTPQKSGQAEDSAIFSKWGKFLIQERARYGFVPNVSAVRNLKAFQRILEHYMSLPVPAIQNTVFQWQHPTVLLDEFGWAEKEWQESRSHLLKPHPRDEGNDRDSGDEIVIDFKNGWAWWKLGRSYCPEEAKAMGHCGNEAAGPDRPDDRILSLRRKVVIKGDTWWEPHLTFILDTDDDSLGEMKGRGNEKPAPQYHPYIIKLLESSLVKKVKGGGYLPEHNFRITDLPVKEQERLMELKPSLGTYLFRLRKEGKTPELVEDVGQALRFGHDDWKPSLDGYAMGQWDNVEEYAQQHGNDTAQWIVKVMSGGEFLDIDPYSPKDNMEQVLDSCKPETLALVLRNLKHFHPRAVVAWMAEGNEDTYGEDAAKVDAADEMACAAFLAGIDLTETSLAQSSAIVQLVEDQDLDEASGNLLGAWGDAARSGTEGEMTKYFKSAMEDLLGTTSDWGTFLVQDGNSFWESPIYEVMPFAKAVELADGETDDVWAWTENEGRLQGHEMDLKVDEPYSGFNEWDEQYADERVKETFHFKEDPELAGKKKRTRVRKPVNK